VNVTAGHLCQAALLALLLFVAPDWLCAQAGGYRTTFTLNLHELAAPQATAAIRAEQSAGYNETSVSQALAKPFTRETAREWRDALWAAKLLRLNSPGVLRSMRTALGSPADLEQETLRSLLETAYGLDLRAFRFEAATIAEQTTSPKLFAMASLYTARAATPDNFESVRRRRLATMKKKFPAWRDDPILAVLHHDLQVGRFSRGRTHPDDTSASIARHDLKAFFSRDFASGHPVVYSIHRTNRDQQGVVIVRDPNGRFIRTEFGNVWSVGHLARSMSNLPGYITNGNTPQGVFAIVGVDVTRNRVIGQTPFLETVLPIEANVAQFFHEPDLRGTSWTAELYRNLLPGTNEPDAKSWRDFFPVYEAWFAGVAGRYAMLAHGTTVNPLYYEKQPWFPNTPTIGCICAKEIWDPETGAALLSDQLALVKAYLKAAGASEDFATRPPGPGKGPFGYFVVLEIDNQQRPVTLDDFLMDLLHAEHTAP